MRGTKQCSLVTVRPSARATSTRPSFYFRFFVFALLFIYFPIRRRTQWRDSGFFLVPKTKKRSKIEMKRRMKKKERARYNGGTRHRSSHYSKVEFNAAQPRKKKAASE